MILSRRLGIGALALGVAAPFAGSPYRPTRGPIDVDAIVKAIEDGSDHVDARTLAGWIRDRKPGLRVIDVRDARAFADYAIPTAENMPIDRLLRTTFDPTATIVLYSAEGAHAGQAWVLLRAAGVHNVVFVPGGLADWQDEVMSPALPADMPDAQRAETAELSHYFGGSPRIGAAGTTEPAPSVRRRGC